MPDLFVEFKNIIIKPSPLSSTGVSWFSFTATTGQRRTASPCPPRPLWSSSTAESTATRWPAPLRSPPTLPISAAAPPTPGTRAPLRSRVKTGQSEQSDLLLTPAMWTPVECGLKQVVLSAWPSVCTGKNLFVCFYIFVSKINLLLASNGPKKRTMSFICIHF